MKTTGVKQSILDAAAPYLQGRTLKDLVIGISLIACELDDGSVGVSYVLRNGLPPECGAFGFARELIGKSALEVAQLFIDGTDNVQRSVGDCVLIAASQQLDGIEDDSKEAFFGIEPCPEDTVGMIGLIGPVAKALKSKVGKLIVFDEGISTFYGTGNVFPMCRQEELLPQCNKVIITGSSTINGSIDGLLSMCAHANEIVMVGSSTPMFVDGWKGTGVTSLAGSWWKNDCKEDIFRRISLGGGIMHLKQYAVQKIVRL